MKICMICKSESDSVTKPKFSDNFVSWNLFSDGDGLCDACQKITHDQRYRKSSWIMQNGEAEFFKRDKIFDVLLSEKRPPFLIYFTESYKKLGYLNILSRPNFSTKKFIVAFDNQVIQVEMTKLENLIEIAKEAKEKKFSKTEMLSGPNVRHWEHEDLCIRIMNVKHDPLWRLVVFGV